jgi:glycosyltransferase involved in cell wall biosynthesis
MHPIVSIILPAYNAEAYIFETITSVLNQSFSDFELLIINDGSTDRTLNIIQEFTDIRIRTINQPNGGHSIARNRGIIESRGKYISFIDADDLWTKEKLLYQVEFLETNTNFNSVYTLGEAISSDGSFLNLISFEGYSGNILPKLFFNPLIIHCSSILIKSEVFRIIKGFRIDISHYEDWDLFLRISSLGSIGYINKVLFKRRMHHQGTSDKTFKDTSYITDALNVVEFNAKQPYFSNRFKNKVLCYVYKMEGFRHLNYNDRKSSRFHFFQAIKKNPLKLDLYFALSYTFMNKSLRIFLHTNIYQSLKVAVYSLKN